MVGMQPRHKINENFHTKCVEGSPKEALSQALKKKRPNIKQLSGVNSFRTPRGLRIFRNSYPLTGPAKTEVSEGFYTPSRYPVTVCFWNTNGIMAWAWTL